MHIFSIDNFFLVSTVAASQLLAQRKTVKIKITCLLSSHLHLVHTHTRTHKHLHSIKISPILFFPFYLHKHDAYKFLIHWCIWPELFYSFIPLCVLSVPMTKDKDSMDDDDTNSFCLSALCNKNETKRNRKLKMYWQIQVIKCMHSNHFRVPSCHHHFARVTFTYGLKYWRESFSLVFGFLFSFCFWMQKLAPTCKSFRSFDRFWCSFINVCGFSSVGIRIGPFLNYYFLKHFVLTYTHSHTHTWREKDKERADANLQPHTHAHDKEDFNKEKTHYKLQMWYAFYEWTSVRNSISTEQLANPF